MGRSGDEWDGSERYGGSVSNAIPLLLAYSIEASVDPIVAVMSHLQIIETATFIARI